MAVDLVGLCVWLNMPLGAMERKSENLILQVERDPASEGRKMAN